VFALDSNDILYPLFLLVLEETARLGPFQLVIVMLFTNVS